MKGKIIVGRNFMKLVVNSMWQAQGKRNVEKEKEGEQEKKKRIKKGRRKEERKNTVK